MLVSIGWSIGVLLDPQVAVICVFHRFDCDFWKNTKDCADDYKNGYFHFIKEFSLQKVAKMKTFRSIFNKIFSNYNQLSSTG